MRTIKEWKKYCDKVTAGFVPGNDKSKLPASGLLCVELLNSIGLLEYFDHTNLLDIGCGNGRLAIGLDICGFEGNYYGFDIIKPCIDFCRGAFKTNPYYHFEFIDLYSAHYWPQGKIMPENVVYPYADSAFDLITAFSVFSHTGALSVVSKNIQECIRVLKPRGAMLSTWYFGSLDCSEAKSIYPDTLIIDILHKEGFDLIESYPWKASDQSVLVCYKKL